MDAFEILVIILSAALAVFLVLAILSLYYIIKVLQNVRRITEKAEHIAGNIDSVGEFFKKTAGPAAVAKLLANIIDVVKSKKSKE